MLTLKMTTAWASNCVLSNSNGDTHCDSFLISDVKKNSRNSIFLFFEYPNINFHFVSFQVSHTCIYTCIHIIILKPCARTWL